MTIILEKSGDVFRIVLAVGVLICICLVLTEIIRAMDATASELSLMSTRLTPVLLLTGVLITAFLVMKTENALAISISVLIIGTVVAGDRFLLSITALLTNQGGEGSTFVRDFYADDPATVFDAAADTQERTALAEEIVRAIAATQAKDQSEEAAVLVVEDFIGRAQVAQLAEEVTLRNAQQPLLRLYQSSEAFAQFAADNFGNPVLQEQMVYLRQLGLMDYLASDLTDASLTDIGFQVAAALARPFEIAEPVATFAMLSPQDALAAQDPTTFPVLAIGTDPVLQPISWGAGEDMFVSLDISGEDFYVIEVIDPAEEGLDTIMDLYTQDGTVVTSDDDGGEGVLSRILERLEAGTYYLRIAGFSGQAGTAALSIQR